MGVCVCVCVCAHLCVSVCALGVSCVGLFMMYILANAYLPCCLLLSAYHI